MSPVPDVAGASPVPVQMCAVSYSSHLVSDLATSHASSHAGGMRHRHVILGGTKCSEHAQRNDDHAGSRWVPRPGPGQTLGSGPQVRHGNLRYRHGHLPGERPAVGRCPGRLLASWKLEAALQGRNRSAQSVATPAPARRACSLPVSITQRQQT